MDLAWEFTDPPVLLMLALSAAMFLLFGRVLRRAGFSPWWVLVGLVPLVNLVVLWIFAYTRWPALDDAGRGG